jgi:hypothetical protein
VPDQELQPRPQRTRSGRPAPPAQYCGITSPIHAPHAYRGVHDGRERRLLCPGARWATP